MLYRAAENGHEAVVKILIASGVMAKVVTTALCLAAEIGHTVVVKTLVAGGAMAETTDRITHSVISSCSKRTRGGGKTVDSRWSNG